MRITRGDVFHDITKIKDITNSNMGQSISANAQSAGNAYGNISASNNSISNSAGSVNTKYSQWDEGVSDRELLLDAATEENASEAVLAYARKYRAYEGLLRREERLKARLEAARAAEQSRTGSEGPSGTPAPASAHDDGGISRGTTPQRPHVSHEKRRTEKICSPE